MRHLFFMRRIAYILIVLFALSFVAAAQQQHFIYLQADNKLPFSVRLSGKYYSSSSIGYLILPKLTDGTYTIQVGFAQNSFPEQAFTLTVAGKDYGYALKNFDSKGWGLFNFQTTDIVMNNTVATPAPQPAATVNMTSAFGNMLADAINDSTINTVTATDTLATAKPVTTTPVAAIPETAKATITAKAADTSYTVAAGKTEQPVDTTILTASFDTTVQSTPAFTTTGVIKAWESANDKGTDLMFIDFNGTKNDTINAFIPSAVARKGLGLNDTFAISTPPPVTDTIRKTVSNPFFNQSTTTQSNTANTTPPASPNLTGDNTAAPARAMVNATCSNMLSENDLSKLKKKIISQTNQDAALAAVRKSLKDKCITTEQVKDLGNLFLNDESRYGFYDAVYPFVYDVSGYAALESTLIDAYFKNRFKALLR